VWFNYHITLIFFPPLEVGTPVLPARLCLAPNSKPFHENENQNLSHGSTI
jgi:hypothetical protein